MKPYFSIITCTRNSKLFLKKNIDSVKNQTFIDYEHIFVDGMSNDGTKELIKKNKQAILIVSKPNGISNAMNIGIKKARGKFIIHLHSDDSFCSSDVLQRVYNFLENSKKVDWLYGKIQTVEESGKKIGIFPRQKIFQKASPLLLKFLNFIPHQAVFVKKEVFEKFGYFDESLSSQMDYDFWLRIKDKIKWKFIDTIVSNYTIRASAQSSGVINKIKNQNNLKEVQKKYLGWFDYFLARMINLAVEKVNTTYR